MLVGVNEGKILDFHVVTPRKSSAAGFAPDHHRPRISADEQQLASPVRTPQLMTGVLTQVTWQPRAPLLGFALVVATFSLR